MSDIKTALIKAKQLIDSPEKWNKGSYYNQDHSRMCAVAAIDKAWSEVSGGRNPRIINVFEVVRTANPNAFDNYNTPDILSIDDYNDAASTTHPDIMQMFDNAIASVV